MAAKIGMAIVILIVGTMIGVFTAGLIWPYDASSEGPWRENYP